MSESETTAASVQGRRVSVDELDEGWTQTLYEGKPFTGIAVEARPDGSPIAETEYRNGLAIGIERTWYPNHQLEMERHVSPWGLDGIDRRWRPDGRLQSEAVYEYGIQTSRKEWDEEGNVIHDTLLQEDDPDYARLQERRRLHSEPGPSA